VTAHLRVIRGGIADRETVAGLAHAEQELAHARQSAPRPVPRKAHLQLVDGEPRKIRCGCGHNECNAPELEANWLRHEAAWEADKTQSRLPADLARGAYVVAMNLCMRSITHPKFGDMRQLPDNTWQEYCSAGWLGCAVVSVYVKVRDEYRDILYKIVPHGGSYIARAVPGQQLTEDEAQQHEEAAIGQWELERGL